MQAANLDDAVSGHEREASGRARGYVNNVIKGKLLESETLRQQATNNTKEQFANSPDLKTELLNAIMGALDAHTAMSTQALNSETVQQGIKDVLLNNARLYETLRTQERG
jgi:type I restriction enzyme R subunit